MSPEELAFIYKHASVYGVFAFLAAAIAYLIARHALGSYFSEKGKNLATKEDIAEITRKVEDVRAPYNRFLEELKAKHQLRLSAVDKRLQAHQESFVLWRELLRLIHEPEVVPVVMKCQTWWEQNCLYLEPSVREAFVRAYLAARAHPDLVKQHAPINELSSNFAEFKQFQDELFRAIQLPPLVEVEKQVVPEERTQ